MNRTHTFLRIAALLALSLIIAMPVQAKKKNSQPKYVFYMIGDGMGINEVYGAQIYNRATGNGPETINFTQFPVRTFITTHSSSSLVTDSAAGGTALATGVKTYNDGMGVDPDQNPVSSLSEWAHAKGIGTGVATSVGVNHATPAAFYAHTRSRSEYEKIAEQLIAADYMDFAAGAGFLNERRRTGHDSQYLEKMAKDAGITVLHGKNEFKNIAKKKGKVICLSADPSETELKYAIDRRGGETELSHFVEAGIEYLYGHFAKKGFFFMIEGGKIDYAGHNDDAAGNFMEINDFASAVDVVLAFYDQHPDETLIVITADHETGGLILGSGKYEMSPELVGPQKENENMLSARFRDLWGDGKHVNDPSWEQVKAFFREHLGLWGSIPVDPRQEENFKAMYDRMCRQDVEDNVQSLYSNNNRMVSDAIMYANAQAGYSWAHGSHSGSPVGLYVKGNAATEFNACKDNVDVPLMIKAVAGY